MEVASSEGSSGDHLYALHGPQLFSVPQYIEQYGDRLDGGPFPAMRPTADIHQIRVGATGRPQDSIVGVWIKRCGQSGRR